MKYERRSLSELCSLANGYPFKSKDFCEEGVPVIKIANVKPNRILSDNLQCVSEDVAKMAIKSRIKKGDILLTMTGNRFEGTPDSWVGKVAQFDLDGEYLLNQRLCIVRPNEGVDPVFLAYALSSWSAQLYFVKHATSSGGQANISPKTVNAFEIPCPPIDIQKRIADTLRILDEKISLNNRINNNLSKQIQILCNAWLNEYAPFGYKCPKDWELTPLSSIARFIGGYSYKSNELQESATAMATIKNFERRGGFKLDGYKEIVPSEKLKPEHRAELFDTLVAHTDLTQNADVIGNAEPVLSKSGYTEIIFSMDLVKVIPKNAAISKFLIAAILQTQRFKNHCLGYVNGTTVLHLSKKALPEYSLMLPSNIVDLRPLDETIMPMYKQMAVNIDENTCLSKMRDSLLPNLMSGKVDISCV